MTEKKEETKVQKVNIDLDEFLGQPGAEAIMVPGEKDQKKPGIFAPLNVDTSFLDKAEETEKVIPEDETPEAKIAREKKEKEDKDAADAAEVAAEANKGDVLNLDASEEEEKKVAGRPTSLLAVTKKLIDKKVLVPFDDGKKLEDYKEEDYEELLEANFNQMKEKLEEEVPTQFFEGLPAEMQQAYQYLTNGGTDLKGLFHALAVSQEITELDITDPDGQKYAIRAYLQATKYGTPEEVEEEITALEDRNELEKKAKQFKPKLDAMQQEIVNQKLANQAAAQKKRAAQSQKYIESVYGTLEKGELNGLKLNNKTQNMLYAGLIQSNYPSMTGRQTNMLGHLLEKYQWVEPRHDLIAEALWLLADPDDYHQNVIANVEKDTNKKVMRTLKTEQSNKGGGSETIEDDEPTGLSRKTGLQKPKKNFFART